MEFLSQLEETDESIQVRTMLPTLFGNYEDNGFRVYKKLHFNNDVSISIQASYGHYCSPRKTLDITQYNQLELAIFKDGQFVSVDQVLDNSLLVSQLEECYEGTVYGYVPVEVIENLYQELSNPEASSI